MTVLGDREERIERLRDGDVLGILERALLTGHIARPLDEGELAEVAPAALRALRLWVLKPDPRLTTPRGVTTLSSLLAASPRALVHAVNNSAASGLLDVRAATRLGLFLFRDLRAEASVDDDELRILWSIAPVVAGRLDLVGGGGPERESRLLETLNWEPSQGSGALVTGEPVDQRIAGRPGDQLVALRDAIDLVPRAVLDVDTLVVANFEWLIAASGGECDIEAFVAGWRRRILLPPDLTDVMRRHLEKREPPPGTVPWARFPGLTLSAALALTADPGDHTAYDLLWEATVFAPKLVARDIVLATALLLDTSRYEP